MANNQCTYSLASLCAAERTLSRCNKEGINSRLVSYQLKIEHWVPHMELYGYSSRFKVIIKR